MRNLCHPKTIAKKKIVYEYHWGGDGAKNDVLFINWQIEIINLSFLLRFVQNYTYPARFCLMDAFKNLKE